MTSTALTQTTKPARQWNGVLDGDIITGDNDALNQKSNETLSAGEIECIEPFAHRSGEGAKVVTDASQAFVILAAASQFLDAVLCCSQSSLKAFASCLEFIER
jgi:hypothetical protein